MQISYNPTRVITVNSSAQKYNPACSIYRTKNGLKFLGDTEAAISVIPPSPGHNLTHTIFQITGL